MSLPSIERSPILRPAAAETVLSKASAIIPVAPVNPRVTPSAPLVSTPGVVNLVSPALQASQQAQSNGAEPSYTGVPDPLSNSAASKQAPHDWTIQRPAQQKVEDPPKKPLSEVLLDNLKSIWTASASAIQVEQVSNQLNRPVPTQPTQIPGDLAKQVLTYQPSKIKKNEKL